MYKMRFPKFLTLGLVATCFILILAGCQPQVVEVEVTRVVTETETVVEEVVVEKEVEVIKEVEVEVSGEIETGSGRVEASGSEQEEPNPNTPKKGKVQANQAVAARMDVIQSTDLVTNPSHVRILASSMDNVLIYMGTEVDGQQKELIITRKMKRFTQSPALGEPADSLFLIMTDEEWEAIAADVERLVNQGFPPIDPCQSCNPSLAPERIILLTDGQVIIQDVQPDQQIEVLSDFFTFLRQYMAESELYAEQIWQMSGPK